MKYTVIYSAFLDDLIRDVNEHCDLGWVPLGGVVVSSTGCFAQAMQRDERP